MANIFKPIQVQSSTFSTSHPPIKQGQIIFVIDTKEIYIDTDDAHRLCVSKRALSDFNEYNNILKAIDEEGQQTPAGKVTNELIDTWSNKAEKIHMHTKDQVGLGNVDNTSDASKSVAYATNAQSASSAGYAANAGKVNNHSVQSDVPKDAKFTDTWRPIEDNLISDAIDHSLSAKQGKALQGQINQKANISHKHSTNDINTTDNAKFVSQAQINKWDSKPSSDTKYNIATTATAGIVKAGGDIDVSIDGIMSVKDNSHKHTKSDISDFPSSMPASDVSSWAKASNKPSYNADEISSSGTTHQFVTSEEKSTWNSKANGSHKHSHGDIQSVNASVVTSINGSKLSQSVLPSYVDDVIEVSTYSKLPSTGETGKIYVTTDTNKTYRWSGSAYVVISETLALGTTSSTAYQGDLGNTAYQHSQIKNSNPHGVSWENLINAPTELPASDVKSWAKADNKPSYNLDEISNGSTYTRVTPGEKSTWNNKVSNFTASASVSNTTGTPSVKITKGGTTTNPTYDFAFSNIKGEKGDKGDDGAPGKQGNIGPTGPAGKEGPRGATGPAGPTGSNGAKGDPGVSVTHSWSGSKLTLTSASGTTTTDLRGPQGNIGPAGPVGKQGATGPAGAKGDPGENGSNGAKGDKGDPGVYYGTSPKSTDKIWINPNGSFPTSLILQSKSDGRPHTISMDWDNSFRIQGGPDNEISVFTPSIEGIVARGKSNGWEWIKWSDGRAECSKNIEWKGNFSSTSPNGWYTTGKIDCGLFPFRFNNIPPVVTISPQPTANCSAVARGTSPASTTSAGSFELLNTWAASNASARIGYLAIGRWK